MPTVTPEGLVETVKDFSPAGDIENIVEAGESFSKGKYGEGLLKTAEGGLPLLMGAIGTALGSPAGGAAAYGGTKAAIKGGKTLINKFTTSRGSTYDHFDSGTTIRNRSSKDHPDKTEGIQPESGKTIFVDYEGANTIGPLLQNTEISTQLLPVFDKNNKLTGAKVVLLEDYGPKKAGETIEAVPAKMVPEKGLYPVEIWRSESPMGDSGRGIHFGNKIIDVTPETKAAIKGGKKAVEDILQYSNKQDISEKIPTKWYRGTNNVGETVNPPKWENTRGGVLGGGGIYVTPDPESASRYAAEGWEGTRTSGGFVTPLDVDFKNPLIIELNKDTGYYVEREALIQLGVPAKKAEKIAEKALENKGGFTTELKKRALDAGYDGIILKFDGKITEAIVYNPERTIKSSITKKKKGGSVVERNPYSNYKPKAI